MNIPVIFKVFLKKEVAFLGYSEGVKRNPGEIRAIKQFPTLKTTN